MVFKVSKEVYEVQGLGKRRFVLGLPHAPIKALRLQLEAALEQDLSAIEEERGEEAHITVVTSSESESLDPVFPVKEIKKSFKEDLFKVKFRIECLGQARKMLNGKMNVAYFLVVHSKGLLRLREKIQREFEKRGGEKSQFNPKKYYPHITVGYTEKDLHLEDGAVKNKESCFADVEVV